MIVSIAKKGRYELQIFHAIFLHILLHWADLELWKIKGPAKQNRAAAKFCPIIIILQKFWEKKGGGDAGADQSDCTGCKVTVYVCDAIVEICL